MTCSCMSHTRQRDIDGRRSCFYKNHAHARLSLCGHLGTPYPSRESAAVRRAL